MSDVRASPGGNRAAFATTHWTLVVSAGETGDSTATRDALETLCRTYWLPLYAYVRRRGHAPHDAQDLTQEFFARLLDGNWIARADPSKGRFRTFMLTALNRFLANEWDRSRAQKRGGDRTMVPLQLDGAETRLGAEPADPASTPEQAFERRWALTLLDEVVQKLEAEQSADGKAVLFRALKPCLVGEAGTQSYDSLARELGLSEGAIKVSVHRLRRRYRELLRHEIAQTISHPAEVDSELRHLLRVFSA